MAKMNNWMVGTIAIALVVLAISGSVLVFRGSASQSAVQTPLTPEQQTQAILSCGSEKSTAVELNLKNDMNTTGSELFDASYNVYEVNADGSKTFKATGSDTTAGSISLDCGKKYNLVLVTDGSADNSRIKSILSGSAKVEADGSVSFTTTSPSLTLYIVGSKHATPVVRAYDENSRASVFDSSDASAVDYEADGVTFQSTLDNATPTSVTAGSSMIMTVEIKNSDLTADYNDNGVLVGFDASTSYWDRVQSVSFDGVALTDIKGQLTPEEAKAFADYEYVFLLPAGKTIDSGNHKLYFDVLKSSGASGSNTLQVDLAVRGNYASIDGINVKTGGAKDSAGSPVVYPIFDMNFAVTD